ncbi:hypothetical protein HF888_15530 [Bermanella marisrubri]|uniref:Ferric siderophore reductase C-terminal domain-containing protein n=1 Tax=Bermanella marisrubri TaxID=207949 RepID=Q1N2D4_9GAMM|nr:(2Fe-2S)-binding protein [Bermanella marisrubri]EAT12473.1 hypothetical protein RED65_16586 [Oceanobacter sp. RED65] [Bermanella marisrubri]QIZ85550.1 hypothetical protein HF888_15530 [Bermanella marisrubri]
MKDFDCLHDAIIPFHDVEHCFSVNNANACQHQVTQLCTQVKNYYHTSSDLYGQYRLWTLLYWQPVYIALSAVHLNHGLVDVTHIQQVRHDHQVYGYKKHSLRLTQEYAYTSQLIAKQSDNLTFYLNQMFSLLKVHHTYKKKLCMNLVVDTTAMGLLALFKRGGHCQTQIQAYLRLWLSHLGLKEQANRAEQILVSNSKTGLQLIRNTCCFYYLVDSQDVCASCPRPNRQNPPRFNNTIFTTDNGRPYGTAS